MGFGIFNQSLIIFTPKDLAAESNRNSRLYHLLTENPAAVDKYANEKKEDLYK